MLYIGDTYIVKIEDTNIYANGICHIENMVVFVTGAITNEVCKIKITKINSKFAFADCTEIIEKSDHRITPVCQHYDKCGGCSFLHTTIDFENEVKYNYVKSAFLKQHLSAAFENVVSPVREKYRNKVVLFFDGKEFGYMQKGTNKIVAHKSCLLNDVIFDNVASFVANELKNTSIRALYLRKSSQADMEIMVCPIFYKRTDISLFAKKLIAEFPQVKSVLTAHTSSKDFALENVSFESVLGNSYINDILCGLSFRISPESFYQVNHTCAELLYEKAIELAALSKNSTCADLFCGTGTIGIISASKTGAMVYGVEIVEKAIEDAKFNAKLNNISNVHFEAKDASKFNCKIDTCIVDPPRKGCSQLMIDTLLRLNPSKIVYVSCNVDTLARDIKSLSQSYNISSPVSIFNLFPRTSHVESVVCLSREKADDYRKESKMISDERSRYKSWSNLKKHMNDLLCDSLKDKISYFYTSYHEVHNAYGRATINYCKKEMVAFSWVEMYKQEQEVSQLYQEGKKVSYGELEKGKWMPECKLCDADFINSLTIYLKTDIATSLNSDNYLLRVFAYMDRRVGKRTLIKIKDDVEKLPDWVKQFYRIRCEADGIIFPPKRITDESVVCLERR